jgi:hypothetical protein
MAEETTKRSNHIIGNVGLYFACYRLSLLGWNVMPTARNARGIDIVAYSTNGSRFLGLQVKALSKCAAVPLGHDLDRITGDFWIIVANIASGTPESFILTPAEVRERAGRASTGLYWLQHNRKDNPRSLTCGPSSAKPGVA